MCFYPIATISYDAIKHKLELGGIDNVNRKVITKMIARQATLVMTAMGFDDPGAVFISGPRLFLVLQQRWI